MPDCGEKCDGKCSESCGGGGSYRTSITTLDRDKVKKPSDRFRLGMRVEVEGQGTGVIDEIRFDMVKVKFDGEKEARLLFPVRFVRPIE